MTTLRATAIATVLTLSLAVAPTAGATPAAQVTVPAKAGTRLPNSFFGLSTEYWALPQYEQQFSVFTRVLSLLRVGDDGPLVLRIGGNSADTTFWNPGSIMLPAGAFVLTPSWFVAQSQLVNALGLRLLLDLNLKRGTPATAKSFTQAALSGLPAHSIAGLEVGNEPDQYGHSYRIADYVRDFRAYANALKPIAPHIPMLGPAITSTSSNLNWLKAVVGGDHAQLGMLTGHRYPLDACAPPGSPFYATIPKVLGRSLTVGLANSVRPAVQVAHKAKRPFRLDELNSVTCGGQPGVSNTFATSLWAPDALFNVFQTGADGVNLHMRPDTVNRPFSITSAGLQVRPLLYGLILFVRAAGPGGRVVPVKLRVPSSLHLVAWAVRFPGHQLHVLLIDKGSGAGIVAVRTSGSGAASLQRLLAPSVSATSGVTLAGQQLATDGTWTGTKVIESVPRHGRGYSVRVPGYSAALLTINTR